MDIFNIICGVCSILGFLVSLFTASRVVKISQTINYGYKDHSKVINKGSRNTYHGSYAGRDSINGTGSSESK